MGLKARAVKPLQLAAEDLNLAVAHEGLILAAGIAVLQVEQVRHPHQACTQEAAQDQVVVVRHQKTWTMAAHREIRLAGPGPGVIGQANQMPHGLPVGSRRPRDVDRPSRHAVVLAPITQVPEPGIPAVPVGGPGRFIDLGGLAVCESGRRVAAEGSDQTLKTVRRQFIVVIQFDQNLAPAEGSGQALDGPDIAAMAVGKEGMHPWIQSGTESFAQADAIIAGVIDDDPLPLRVGRSVPTASDKGG